MRKVFNFIVPFSIVFSIVIQNLFAGETIPKNLAEFATLETKAKQYSAAEEVQYQEGFVKGFRSALVNNSPYLQASNGDKFWESGFKDGRAVGLSHERPQELKDITLRDFGFEKIQAKEGFVYIGFEQSHFQPLHSSELWWVESYLPSTQFRLPDETIEDRKNLKAVYVKAGGWLSPKGIYGHMGSCQREFFIESVLELRRSTEEKQAGTLYQPLQLTIKFDKQVYEVGEEIKLEAIIKNNSDKEQIIFWSDESPRVGIAGGNHMSTTVEDDYKFPRILFVPKSAEKIKPLHIKPGNSTNKVAVFKIDDFGKYPVMMKYEFEGDLGFSVPFDQQLCLGPIISNTITIEVVERKLAATR